MGIDRLGVIDLDDLVSPDIPRGKRGVMVTPSDLMGERPGGDVTTRPATQEECRRYGISHPLRPELVEDIQAGLGLEAIGAKHGAPIRDIANKVVNWWYRVVRSFPEGQDEAARQVWSHAAAVLGIRERRPPPVPMLPPEPVEVEGDTEDEDQEEAEPDEAPSAEQEPEEREREMPRRDEKLRHTLTPGVLTRELQENTVTQIAKKHGKPEGTIYGLMSEYGITARGVRKDAAAQRMQVPAPDPPRRDVPQPQTNVARRNAGSKPEGWKPAFLEGGAMATIPPPTARRRSRRSSSRRDLRSGPASNCW